MSKDQKIINNQNVEIVDISVLTEIEINDDDDRPDLTPFDISPFHLCNGCPFANEKEMKCNYDLNEETGAICYYEE